MNQGTFFLATMFFVNSGAFLSHADSMFVSSCSTNSSRLFTVIESRFMSSTNLVVYLVYFPEFYGLLLKDCFLKLMVQLTVQWSDI